MRRQFEIELQKAGISQHLSGKLAAEGGKLISCRKNGCKVGGVVVAGTYGSPRGLWRHDGTSVQETHYHRHAKNVLVEPSEKKGVAAADGAAQGKSELLLLSVRLEIKKGMSGSESAVTKEEKSAAVKLIRP